MKNRTKNFLSPENIDPNSEIFSYIVELHTYLWEYMNILKPGVQGNLSKEIDKVLDEGRQMFTYVVLQKEWAEYEETYVTDVLYSGFSKEDAIEVAEGKGGKDITVQVWQKGKLIKFLIQKTIWE